MSTDQKIYETEELLLTQEYPTNPDPRMFAFAKFEAVDPQKNAMLMTAATTITVAKQDIIVPVPSHSALCANISHRAFVNLQGLRIPASKVQGKDEWSVTSGTKDYFDLLELMITNVIFAYTAIEAYANQLVPDQFVFKRMRDDKKCEEIFNKDQIERFLSLDIKLKSVLPQVTGAADPSGTKLWEDFRELQRVRDRLIHVKTADLGLRSSPIDSVWSLLTRRLQIDSSLVAHRMIMHFPQKDDRHSPVSKGRNAWVRMFPFNSPA